MPKLDEANVEISASFRPLLDISVCLSPEEVSVVMLLAGVDPNDFALAVKEGASEPNGEADDLERAAKPDNAKSLEDMLCFESKASGPAADVVVSDGPGLARAVKGDAGEMFENPLFWVL